MNLSSRNTISFVEIGKQLKVVELLFTLTTHFLLKEGVTQNQSKLNKSVQNLNNSDVHRYYYHVPVVPLTLLPLFSIASQTLWTLLPLKTKKFTSSVNLALTLSRNPQSILSDYVNTETILHFFYKITNERGTKTLFAYAHVKWFYGQSERAYYLNYFIMHHSSRFCL